MDNTRIIPVRFGKEYLVVTECRMQYDYGQILDFIDIVLPEAFEARFSNSVSGKSVGQIGYNNQVRIPKQFFESGEPIYCYVTVHDEETDGRTLYTTKVPIKPSSERTEEEPEPEEESIISQAITALNSAVTTTTQKAQEASESADRAEHAAEGVEGYAERAEAAQSASESARDRAVEAETSARTSAATATEKASEAISSATTASQSAITAENASESAGASADASYQNAQTAYRYAQDSATSAGQADESAHTASSKATEASQKASEAAQSASTAVQAKTDAETAKVASETAQGLAESARNEAVTAKTSAESARDEAQEIVDGITGKVEQIDSNTDRIESLEDDRYKPYPTDTASGSVASFPDGADGIPLKSCIVRVEPVQDLHGYDHPWPAGGGKNKINAPDITLTSGGYIYNGALILPAGTYTMSLAWSGSGTPSASFGIFDADGNALVSGSHNFPYTFTISAESVTARFYASAVGTYSKIQIESGSTATSYAPYSNECPITGWTGCEVQRTGKNLFNGIMRKGRYNTTTGEFENTNWYTSELLPVKPNTTYAFVKGGELKIPPYSYQFDEQKQYISNTHTTSSKIITTRNETKYIAIAISERNFNENYLDNFMICKGKTINDTSTAIDYEPYTGHTYPITFPTEAGTVYGGYIDPINGELVVDRAMVDLGTLTWERLQSGGNAEYLARTGIDSSQMLTNKSNEKFICSSYYAKTNNWNNIPFYDKSIGIYKTQVRVCDTAYTDATAFKTAMDGVQLVYELAEPIHYPLTPIDIKTILGQDNIWADTGDTEVEYRADVTLYINKKIAEAISALS